MKKLILMMIVLLCAAGAEAKQMLEVTYRIVEYNADNAEFVLSPCGQVPMGAAAWFENDYGATYGNRYNQIPRNREAALHLEGWAGCTITGMTLSMCSNNKSGTIGYNIEDGETMLMSVRPVDFGSEAWYGEWVSKDLGVYVDIERELNLPTLATDECTITLKAGTPEGSVYINAVTIRYEAPDEMQTESPLGWAFEKLEKKSTLNDGDVVMIYRSGCAATDLDGMETSHYLDAAPVQSTSNVDVHNVLLFTTNKDSNGTWTLTDQQGRKLGARAKQNLAWNEGNTQWTITLGYDGATIASTNSNYGTLRYNAPEGSYARFWNYTSTSLQLPYLYRRLHQNEPTLTYSLGFDNEELTISMDDALAIGLRPTISPKNTTDQRMEWTSSNTSVATVDGGYVRLLSAGETVITARTRDNGTEAQLKLIVTGSTTRIGTAAKHEANSNSVRKFIENKRIIIKKNHQRYNVDGSVLMH